MPDDPLQDAHHHLASAIDALHAVALDAGLERDRETVVEAARQLATATALLTALSVERNARNRPPHARRLPRRITPPH